MTDKQATLREVLFISKPVAPPWNDSNKNLVRDVSRSLRRYRARVMVPRGRPLDGVISEPIYAAGGDYAPSRWANAGVLARLVAGPRADVWHFFFGPNPLTLRAGSVAARVRGAATVHTIASAPDDLERIAPLLFADRVIALSAHTCARLERAGVHATTIPPALALPSVTPEAIARARGKYALPARYVLYPGDLEFGDGAATFVAAAALAPEIGWVVASRPKTALAHAARASLEAEARRLNVPITWLGAVDDIHAIVAGAAVVALVSNTLHAKMDWPLVLLEAMALSVPVLIARNTAADELSESGAAFALSAGEPSALVASVRAWLSRSNESRAVSLDSGRAWVARTCDPLAVAAAHEAVYDEVLAARGRSKS